MLARRAAILREYIANKPSGLLLRSSRDGGPLLQRNINRDFLHPVLESIGLRKAEHWIEDGVRRVKCLDGDGKAWHSMRRFRITHLESQGVSESLIKLWAGHGKKGVTEQSYIKIMGRLDVRRKCVEQAGLGFNHVPSVPRGRLENAA